MRYVFLVSSLIAAGPLLASACGSDEQPVITPTPTEMSTERDFDSGARNVITSPDTEAFVGDWLSLVVDGSGNPVVSYYDLAEYDLKLLRCGNAKCSAGNVIASPDTAGQVGAYASLVLDGDGNPVLSYFDSTNEDLKVLHCGDRDCSTGNVITSPDTQGDVGRYTSLVLDGKGNPLVSYYDGTNLSLKVLHCGNPDCSAGNVISSPDTAGTAGTSLALDGNGNPVISYRDLTNYDLKVLHCGDRDCSTSNVIASPDTEGRIDRATSLLLDSDGNPVVIYRDSTNEVLKVLRCGDPNCTFGNVITALSTTGDVGRYASLALDSIGNPVIGYGDLTDVNLKVLHCGDANCTSGNVATSTDTTGKPGLSISLALDASGNPIVTYVGSGHDMRLLHCGNPNCTEPVPDD